LYSFLLLFSFGNVTLLLVKKMIEVVAAVMYKEEKFLIAQRNFQKSQGGLWEFPGGKVEPGETYMEALKREIKEELDGELDNITYLGEHIHKYPDKQIKLIYFTCNLVSDIYLKEHEDYCFITKEERENFIFAEADKKVFDLL